MTDWGIIPGSSGIWSDRISKWALTKTIKTPNCIFRKQSMLCFLKIQLGVFIVFVKAHLDILSLHIPDEPGIIPQSVIRVWGIQCVALYQAVLSYPWKRVLRLDSEVLRPE